FVQHAAPSRHRWDHRHFRQGIRRHRGALGDARRRARTRASGYAHAPRNVAAGRSTTLHARTGKRIPGSVAREIRTRAIVSASLPSLLAQAQAARQRGELAEAEQRYRAALALDARQPEVLYRLAEVLEDMQQPEAAIGCLEDALRLAPAHAPTLHYLG